MTRPGGRAFADRRMQGRGLWPTLSVVNAKVRLAGGLLVALPAACCAVAPPDDGAGGGGGGRADPTADVTDASPAAPRMSTEQRSAAKHMVDRQLEGRDIDDERVLAAMAAVPRHEFVPPDQADLAYEDRPLGIGWGVTISQPYIVALMTQLARVSEGDRVLDVGTGSGYQAAVLAQMGAQVYGIEIIEPLAKLSAERLQRLGYTADILHGDGWKGRPEHAPYDAIIVAAAPPEIPQALMQQLRVGGRLVVPVGPAWGMQSLMVVTRTETGFDREVVAPVAFVPLVEGAPTKG